jgi:hypothetical protein
MAWSRMYRCAHICKAGINQFERQNGCDAGARSMTCRRLLGGQLALRAGSAYTGDRSDRS